VSHLERGFKSIDELIENISWGGEIEFFYNSHSYSITHTKDGIHFMKAYDDLSEKTFKKASEIVVYEIEGKQFGSMIEDITITFRCF
jgi:hypothetical protein